MNERICTIDLHLPSGEIGILYAHPGKERATPRDYAVWVGSLGVRLGKGWVREADRLSIEQAMRLARLLHGAREIERNLRHKKEI